MTITIIQTHYRDGRIMNTPTSITLPPDSLEDYRATILASDPDITSVLFTYDFEKIKKHAVQQDRGDCNQSEEPDGAVAAEE